jgi:hypothetical protein
MPYIDPDVAEQKAIAAAKSAQSTAVANASAEKAKIDALTQQILGQNLTNKWSGEGHGSAQANAADMAKILAGIGITDIKQFGKVKATEQIPLQEGDIVNGNRVYQDRESGQWFEVVQDPAGEGATHVPTSPFKTVTKETFGNKVTGQAVPNTYSERQTDNAWGGTFSGEGNTGYRVQFGADGTPYFYTTGASSNDVVNFLGDDPILNLAANAAAAYFGGPAGVAALQAAKGADIEDIAKSAAMAYVGGEIVNGVSPEISSALQNTGLDQSVANVAGKSITSGLLSEAQGGDFLTGAVGGAISGAANEAKLAAADEYLRGLPVDRYVDSTLPTEQIVLDAIAAEQPDFYQDIQQSPNINEIIADIESALGPIDEYDASSLPTEQFVLDAIAAENPTIESFDNFTNNAPGSNYESTQKNVFNNVGVQSGGDEFGYQSVDDIPEIVITAERPVYEIQDLDTGPILPEILGQSFEKYMGDAGYIPVNNTFQNVVTAANPVDDVTEMVITANRPVANIADLEVSPIEIPSYIPILPSIESNPTVDVKTEQQMTEDELAKKLANADLAKAIATIATTVLLANNGNDSNNNQDTTLGNPIVPIPSDWKSPIYNQSFSQSAPIDFGSSDLLRGTQWERYLSPIQQPVAQVAPVDMNSLMNTLQGVQSGSFKLSDIISGIQDQYGQIGTGSMGK